MAERVERVLVDSLLRVPLLSICLGPGNRWLASQPNLGNGNNCVPLGTSVVFSVFPAYQRDANLTANATEMNFLKLLTIFMVGALIYLYRDQMPDSGWIAGSCAVVFALGLWLPTGGYSPAFALTTS